MHGLAIFTCLVFKCAWCVSSSLLPQAWCSQVLNSPWFWYFSIEMAQQAATSIFIPAQEALLACKSFRRPNHYPPLRTVQMFYCYKYKTEKYQLVNNLTFTSNSDVHTHTHTHSRKHNQRSFLFFCFFFMDRQTRTQCYGLPVNLGNICSGRCHRWAKQSHIQWRCIAQVVHKELPFTKQILFHTLPHALQNSECYRRPIVGIFHLLNPSWRLTDTEPNSRLTHSRACNF